MTQLSPKARRIIGVFASLAVTAGCLAAVLPAFASPGPMPPVGRGMALAATETYRSAYVEAMKADGYVILAPVPITEHESAAQTP